MYASSMSTLQKKRIESFDLVLEHDIDEQYQYTPGEIIRGCAIAKLTEPIKVRALNLHIKGEGTVAWQEDGAHVKKHNAREAYLDVTETLLAALTSDSLALEEGVHEFPFYYELPTSMPSSFIGRYGSITYILKASLQPDRQFGIDALVCSEPFLVLRQLDLSKDPGILQPYECESFKRVIPWPLVCFAGRIHLTLTVNRTGFAPGEDIHLNAEVKNGTLYTITSLQAAVLMHSTFTAQGKSMHATQTVNKKPDYEEVPRGEFRKWSDVRLTVPPYIPETGLEGSDIMGVSYQLAFLVEVEGNPHSSNSLRVHVPITIGTKGIPKHEGMPVTMKELSGQNAGMVTTRMPMYRPKTKSSLKVKKKEARRSTIGKGTVVQDDPHTFSGGDPTRKDGDMGELDTDMFELKAEKEVQPYGGNNEMRENPLYGLALESAEIPTPISAPVPAPGQPKPRRPAINTVSTDKPAVDVPVTVAPVKTRVQRELAASPDPFYGAESGPMPVSYIDGGEDLVGTVDLDDLYTTVEAGPEQVEQPKAPPRRKSRSVGAYKKASEVESNVLYIDPNKKTTLYDDDLVTELMDQTTHF